MGKLSGGPLSAAVKEALIASVAGLHDGRWAVGDAGTVTFAARGSELVLEDVAAQPRWCPRVVREEPRRLLVEFRCGPEEWKFDARFRNGLLTIELEHEQEEAAPGRYEVGEAGDVEFTVEDDRVRLVEIHTNPGWSMEVDERTDREIKVDFRRGTLEWCFEAKLSRFGKLEVNIEMEKEGPFPAFAG